MKKRIFSGVQPSGNLHIGNYLGAIKNWVELQDDYDPIFCVVDLHAITVPQDPAALRKKTLEIAKIYLAAGIDPDKSAIFVQSHVAEHSELMWILNTIAKMSELDKMTQFKDKSQKGGRESSPVGLFDYPVLMAADILLYGTQIVPVGEDQKQHVELARDLAKRFNQKFGETFVVPEAYIRQEGMRIMSLDDPAKKMSKSAPSANSRIELLDSPEDIKRKIKKAVTDSGSNIEYSQEKPALRNLINIYAFFSDLKTQEVAAKFEGKGYGEFKEALAEAVVAELEPFRQRYESLSDEAVLEVLRRGAERVRPLAAAKIAQVKENVGFLGK